MTKWVYLILGGVLGTVSRYTLSGLIHETVGNHFPFGTFVVNLFGCFLIGFLSAAGFTKLFPSPEIKLFLIAGFCGAFTTFSTFMLETATLIELGHSLRAFANVCLSIAFGFIVFRFGIFLGDLL